MKSMTGYGKAKYDGNGIHIEAEIKSINGRYLDMKIYLPRELGFFDYNIRKLISSHLSRGSLEIRLSFKDNREPALILDTGKLLKYHDIVMKARSLINSDADIPLQFLLAETGVIEVQNNLDEDQDLDTALHSVMCDAINQLNGSLEAEGLHTKDVIANSIENISGALCEVEKEIEPFKKQLYITMKSRIMDILSDYKLDTLEQRLVQEMAIYIDRYDIQEELTRLRSHIKVLLSTLDKPSTEDIGKSLNFIIQEMHREANTLGSKFSTSKTFEFILIIKEEIEKCREIIQNVA
jgi:uncharacterized protein (TIGR00255 family)